MPNLHSEIKALLPIDCKRKVDAVFAILKRRRTVINSFINDMICNHIKGRSVLDYYKNNVANVIDKINHNPIISKSTANSTKKTNAVRNKATQSNSSYYLLGDNDSSSDVKVKSNSSSKLEVNWAKAFAIVRNASAIDKITKEQRAAAENWKPQPQKVDRKEEIDHPKRMEEPSTSSVSQSVTPIKTMTKEGLVDIVEALDACASARVGTGIAPIARVHCLYDDSGETFWFTSRLYHPREYSSLRKFGRFVPQYSDIAIKMQKSEVGTSFPHFVVNKIKRVEHHDVFLQNQSDLQNQTIAIAGHGIKYQYRNIQEFLSALRQSWDDIKDVEARISELEEQRKGKKTPQERAQITNSIKKLQEEYRYLTKQQEDLKNITIYIRKQGEMRYSHIVDPIQTGIMSDNLYDGKTVIIKGGPGTGKTTTMIHRLAYLTDMYAIDEDEKNKLNKYKITSVQRRQLRKAIKDNRDWMFFSPSQMLKEYLADAMKKEGLTNTSEKVWNWKDYCRMVLQQNYHLLETDNSNAPFKICNKKETLFYQRYDIITTFTNFYLDQFREIKDQLPKLGSGEKEYEWNVIAKNIRKMFDEAEDYDLAHFVSLFYSLESTYGSDRTRLLRERNMELGELAEKVCVILDENDKAKSEIKVIFDLTSGDEDALEDEDSGDEDVLDNTGGLKDKFKKWFRPNSGNRPMEHELSSEIQKWLKSYCYSKANEESKLTDEQSLVADVLLPLIENKFDDEIRKIGELIVFEQYAKYTKGVCSIMLNGIPARYKKFRGYLIKNKYEGCDLKMLRDLMQNKQGIELHYQEQALLLGFINTLVKKIKDTALANFKHDYIDAYDEVARPIIGIDEATDFSICDIYAMQSLLTRSFNSLTLCGDIMQRMTDFGIKSWSELDNVVENPKPVEMKTSYRQSKKLLEVARQLYSDTLGEIPNYRAFMKSNKVPVPLVYVEENELYKVEWISKRISEVYRAYGKQLPSIAIFVTDKGYIPRFIEYLEDTPFFKEMKIKAIDGSNASNIPENHICVYSIDVVKGMEFDVVFFHNIDKSDADMELVKRYIYVGVSRAAFFLGITMIEEKREISRYFEKNKDWFDI